MSPTALRMYHHTFLLFIALVVTKFRVPASYSLEGNSPEGDIDHRAIFT
jgi:hypothetical protein